MRILNVIASMSAECGGPAQGIRNIMPHLVEAGCTVEVVCLDAPGAAIPPVPESLVIHRLGPVSNRWCCSPRLAHWLSTSLIHYDAITVHGLWLHTSFAVWRSIKNRHDTQGSPKNHKRTPGYWIFPHGMLDPWFQKTTSRRLKAVRNWIYWKLIEHRVVRDAEGMLFTCESERQLARTTFHPYRPRQEINVGYGIEDAPIPCEAQAQAWGESSPLTKGTPFWLFLGRVDQKKGVDLLVQAYAKLVAEFFAPSPSTEIAATLPDLVIAGPGLDSDYGRGIERLTASVPPGPHGPRIHFPGLLLGDAKWGAFYACEAFILPSHQENFGIAVVEALACGKPVLISDQINIWREIHDDGAAFVESDTEAGTLALLKRWMTLRESDKANMGVRARSCFERRFEAKEAARRLLDVLTESLPQPCAERLGSR